MKLFSYTINMALPLSQFLTSLLAKPFLSFYYTLTYYNQDNKCESFELSVKDLFEGKYNMI